MVQIKISIAFVLAVAAIAPTVARPIPEEGVPSVRPHRERHERGGEGMGWGRGGRGGFGGRRDEHEHRERHPHRERTEQALPAVSPDAPSRREYLEEFDVRALLDNPLVSLQKEEKALLAQDNQLKKERTGLQTQDRQLTNTDKGLAHTEQHLQDANHRLQGENKGLKRTRTELTGEDGNLRRTKQKLTKDDAGLEATKHKLGKDVDALSGKKRRLTVDDNELSHRRKVLKTEDGSLKAERGSLLHKNKDLKTDNSKLARKGREEASTDHALKVEGQDLRAHNAALLKAGDGLAVKDSKKSKVLGDVSNVPKKATAAVTVAKANIKAKLAAREFDDMFERDLEGESGGNGGAKRVQFRNSLPLIRGPEIPGGSHRFPAISNPSSFWRPGWGHGPVVHRPSIGLGGPGPVHLGLGGPGPVRLPMIRAPVPATRELTTRGYDESDDLFERDFEDVEFDARDFDEELYLD